MTLPQPLQPLGLYRQWITYRLVPHPTKPGKTDKIPASWRTGGDIDLMNVANYGSYEEAAAGAHLANVGHGSGVGFVFTDADPFWFLDIDGAFTDGQWSPLATELYHALPEAAWEVSQSGRGLHAFGSGALPDHRCDVIGLGLGLYHTKRFVALTLQTYDNGGSAGNVAPRIAAIAEAYFPPHALSGAALGDAWTTEPVPEWSGPDDDEELLKMALASRTAAQAFGSADGSTKAGFAQLWEGDTTGYGQSEADAALASHLAFWTGKNCERIERLMRRSGLNRDKWDRGSPYLVPTIERACATVSKVLQSGGASVAQTMPEEATKALETGQPYGPYIPPADYGRYFAQCAYVVAHNQIFTPAHGLVGSTAFDTIFGGRKFIKDGEGRATSITASAWDAFRMCEMWRPPVATSTCFRPEHATAELVDIEGRAFVNTYAPIVTERRPGDTAPFFDFLGRLIPDERDRLIILSYMAGCVQNPGSKAQWWPVLQGVEGNGKTTLLRVMSHSIGHRYTHLVNPEAMAKTGGQFNAWVEGHLFCGIEEIYVNKRRDFLESFKATVTNDRLAMEGKGTSQFTGDNRCNGILLTNHPDGVPITTDTRRYAVFYTAQQSEADLQRDGMMGDYFPRLYEWLRSGGFAFINEWLQTWEPVAEFNPAGMGPARARAPKTSSHASALRWSLGNAEQEILEAIESGDTGFKGGWVSSYYLGLLLDRLHITIAPNRRRDLMKSIGYDYHPAMVGTDGRCNNPVVPDGRKSRLYLREGHLALNLDDHARICDAYSVAQAKPVERVA